jgi:hypothetical protein
VTLEGGDVGTTWEGLAAAILSLSKSQGEQTKSVGDTKIFFFFFFF